MDLVKETIAIFKAVRLSMVQAMVNLHQIKETGEWEKKYSSWSEFVESPEGLGISQGFASKLLSNHRIYILDGGLDASKLSGVDYEKLYMARALPGTVEEKVEKAKTLSRRELKEERNDEEPHDHIPVTICKTCGIRL